MYSEFTVSSFVTLLDFSAEAEAEAGAVAGKVTMILRKGPGPGPGFAPGVWWSGRRMKGV